MSFLQKGELEEISPSVINPCFYSQRASKDQRPERAHPLPSQGVAEYMAGVSCPGRGRGDSFARAALTQYQRLGGLEDRSFFLRI